MSFAGEYDDRAAGPLGLSFEPVRGAQAIGRLVLRVLGVGLLGAAVLLWLAPGALWEADLVLMKLTLSVVMGAMAWALIRSAREMPRNAEIAEIAVDLMRREVRVVHRGPRGDSVQHVCAFSDLSRAERVDGIVGLWDSRGVHLADVALRDRDAARLLTSALRDAGKL